MLRKYNIQLLNVGFDSSGSQWKWDNVYSPFARIYLVTSGKARVILDNSEICLLPGHLYLIPPLTRHTCIGEEEFSHFYIHMYELPGKTDSMFNELEFGFECEYSPGNREIMEMLTALFPEFSLKHTNPDIYDNDEQLKTFCDLFADRPICERTLAQGAMMVLTARFLKQDTSIDKSLESNLEAVNNFINSNLSSVLSIDQLAKIACLSQSHLIRSFKAKYGITPIQYAMKRRIEVSQLLLIINDAPIKEIAYSLGFNDVSYFTRMFKRLTGLSPDAYRKRKH